jgi:hypothetical protein
MDWVESTVGMSTPGTVSNLTYIDLQQHEATGGHTLRHHVHPTNAMLRQRLASNPQIPGVSKFTDHSTAERIVNMALQANLAQFNAWLASVQARTRFDYDAGVAIGIGFRQVLPPYITGPSPLTRVRLVVNKTWSTASTPFLVLTAFPIV